MKTPKINNWIRRIPISRRVVLLIFLVSILPITLVGFIVYNQAYRAIHKTAIDYSTQMLASLSQTLQASVSAARDFSNTLLAANDVRLLASDYEYMTPSERGKAMLGVIATARSQSQAMSYVNEIRIATIDNVSAFSLGYQRPYVNEAARQFEKAAQNTASELWFLDTLQGQPVLVLVRPILHLGTLERFGYLFLYMSPELFSSFSAQDMPSMDMTLSFCDIYGEVMHLHKATASTPSDEVFADIHEMPQTFLSSAYTSNSSNFICYLTIPELNWKIISSVPYSHLLQPLHSILFICIASILGSIVLCVLISHSIISSITRPLQTMVDYLGKASDMRFENELIDDSSDELGYLAQSYNKICTHMKTLVAHIEQEQADKRRAEIKMLQAQINPHFLFNTLDSLRFTAIMSSVPALSDGLAALSHILRNSILKSDNFIPLHQEISNIRDYLVIQKIRCGESIQLDTEIDPAAKDARIMKLLLQPLVENSVIHGQIEEQTITITIQAKVKNQQLHICVQDDGKGFDPNSGKLFEACKGARMSGVGLNNVRERLALEFKERQSFSIESSPGQGTCVHIVLPYIADMGEEENV